MSEDKYKIYKLDVLTGSEEIRNGLDFLRMDEPGFTVGILPIGENRVHKAVRFTVKDKCFYELGPDSSSMGDTGHQNVKELVDYMNGLSKSGPRPAQSVPTLSGNPSSPLQNGLAFNTMSMTGSTEYRILQKGNRMGRATIEEPASKTQTPGSLIPDKYKIKPARN